jgi:hypothetical protein
MEPLAYNQCWMCLIHFSRECETKKLNHPGFALLQEGGIMNTTCKSFIPCCQEIIRQRLQISAAFDPQHSIYSSAPDLAHQRDLDFMSSIHTFLLYVGDFNDGRFQWR